MVSNPSTKAKTEAIDEVILRLLGLKPGAEIDYQTYFEILKKKLAIARLAGKELPREEDELLREELKRVRRVKDKGTRIKIREAKTKVASVGAEPGVGPSASTGSVKPKSGAIIKAKTAKIVPQSIIPVNAKDITEKTENNEERVGRFDQIKKTLDSILAILSSKFKFDKKQSETDRKEKEAQKRTKREEGLEGFRKGISAVSGAAKKLLAPFQSIIDRIWRFIFFTLLGRAFTQLMEWLGDPANKKKIEVLGRFLKDWWPTLLGAAILFFTPFGKFVRKTLSLVGFFTGRLVKLIPGIAKAVKGLALNPWFAVPAVAVGLTAAANEVTGQRQAAPVQAANKARAQTGRGLGVQGVGGVGDMGPTTPFGLLQGAARGGTVMGGYDGIDTNTGEKVSGFGPDTQMIVAQPGEIVMNKKTVDAVGPGYFLGLNRQYGGAGANKPKMGKMFNTGGMVGRNPTQEELAQRAYGSTVRIEGATQGSGVLVMNSDGNYTVLTAGHVIRGNAPGEEISIITSDGKSHNIKVDDKNLKMMSGKDNIDLGTLQFSSKENYAVATPADLKNFNIKDNDKVFVGGFPTTSETIPESLMRFNEGNILPNKEKNLPQGYNMIYSSVTYPGMSGGPVFNSRGELIGIHGRSGDEMDTTQRERGSRAIPITAYSDLGGTFGTTSNYNPIKPNAKFGKLDPTISRREDIEKGMKEAGIQGGLNEIYKDLGPNIYDRSYILGDSNQIKKYSKKQGGGEIEALEKTYKQGQRSGTNPEILKAIGDEAFLLKHFGPGGVWRHFKGSGATDIRGNIIPKKFSGGLIKENTGMNIRGATADRQLTALQPGEYVIPKDTVDRLGTSLIDKIVAMTDPDSNPAKLGYRSKNVPNITPLPRGGAGGMSGMITLPPISQSASGVGNPGNSSSAGSRAPVFPVVSASGMRQQQENASMYGIVG